MRRRKIFSMVILLGFAAAAYCVPFGSLNLTREGGKVIVRGAHFELTFDCRRGGEMTGLRLWDGAQWNEVLGGLGSFGSEEATYPRLELADREGEYLPGQRFVRPAEEPEEGKRAGTVRGGGSSHGRRQPALALVGAAEIRHLRRRGRLHRTGV